MANDDKVNGLKPVGHIHGAGYSGETREYSVASGYATALFVGDPVKSSGTANADGVPGVELAAAGNNLIGVVTGIKVEQPSGVQQHPGYHPASTAGLVSVNIDPGTIYEVQEDGNMGLVGVGLTADHTAASGNTTNGASGVEIDSSDAGTGAGFKILGFSQRQGNEPANANAKLLVTINEHELTGAGVGV
jgi:hypothetical protein